MPRTNRPSRARAAALTADAPTRPMPVVQVEQLQPTVPTIDDLATLAGPGVFRLLDAGKVRSAWELLMTFQPDAEAAYWAHIADRPCGPATGALTAVAVTR